MDRSDSDFDDEVDTQIGMLTERLVRCPIPIRGARWTRLKTHRRRHIFETLISRRLLIPDSGWYSSLNRSTTGSLVNGGF
jgi:hypothetical protein